MITVGLFVAGALMIVASLVVAFLLAHRSSDRSTDSGDLALVMVEVDRALGDPILVREARRRVTGRHSRDG